VYWIVISIAINLLTFGFGYSLFQYIANTVSTFVALFGLYACIMEKPGLVRCYGYLIAISSLVNLGCGILIFYSPETKVVAQTQYERFTLGTTIATSFDQFWCDLQWIMIVVLIASVGITFILISYIVVFYKYLRQAQTDNLFSKGIA
jgi:hypothetical protein